MAYAEGTTVPPEKSRADIEDVLRRYGAVLPAIDAMYETGEVPDFFGGMLGLGPGGTP